MSDSVRAAFRDQANACARLGSPFTARVLTLAAERLTPGTRLADTILCWPGDPRGSADSIPLRFTGGLNRLALTGSDLTGIWPPATPPEDDDALWAGIAGAMIRWDDALCDWLASPPQTNEVRRAAVLIPVLHLLAATGARLSLLELGASAGLNLICDRFELAAGSVTYGVADPILSLLPDWTGVAPDVRQPVIADRRGVDIRPLDIAQADDRLKLLSYIWPDQPDRVVRTRAAMAAHPPCPDTGDAAPWLERALLDMRDDAMPLIFHTIAWQYFPAQTRDRATAAMHAFGRTRRLARLSLEADGTGPGAAITLTLWPETREIALGRADFHGRWVDWTGPQTLV